MTPETLNDLLERLTYANQDEVAWIVSPDSVRALLDLIKEAETALAFFTPASITNRTMAAHMAALSGQYMDETLYETGVLTRPANPLTPEGPVSPS